MRILRALRLDHVLVYWRRNSNRIYMRQPVVVMLLHILHWFCEKTLRMGARSSLLMLVVFGVGCLQAFSVLLMILRYWHLVPLLFVKCYQYAAPTQHPMVSYLILKRPNSYVSENTLMSLFIQIFYSTGFLSNTLIRCYTSAICCHLIWMTETILLGLLKT